MEFRLVSLTSDGKEIELGPYKLRVATEMAIAETDEEARKEKLRTVAFSALKWQDNIDQKRRGNFR